MKRQHQLNMLIAAFVLLALSLTGCGILNPTTQVSGTLKDKAGDPLAGAIVTLGEATTTTNADGAFLFEKVRKGTYDITIELNDELIYSNEVVVEKKPVTLAITYVTAVVDGNVEFRSGNPVAGVTVQLGTFEAVTDAQGEYNFPAITFGTYDLTVKDGDTVLYGPSPVEVNAETLVLEPAVIRMLISSGKTYTYVDKAPSSTYPDTTVELTDGVTGTTSYKNPEWVGVYTSAPWGIQFDFAESVTVTEVRLHQVAGTAGIKWADKISVVASDDGETWGTPAELIVEDPLPEVATLKWFTIEGFAVTGRYIKVILEPLGAGKNIFVSELEIYQ